MTPPPRVLSDAPVVPLPPGRAARPVVLAGAHVRLVALALCDPAERDRLAGQLHAASHEGGAATLWRWLWNGPFADRAAFTAWIAACAGSADPLFFAILPRAGEGAAGMAACLNIRPTAGVLELGHIWFAPVLQRTAAATEAIALLLAHGFDDLGCRRIEWKCDAQNTASRRAAVRLGFVFEGLFYRHMIIKGRNRDTAWFSIVVEEWPAVGGALRAWLAPGNFDADGRQRRALADLRAAPPDPPGLAGSLTTGDSRS
jgi:RimJ/RimL family protein N-acetyltransferase